MNTKIISGLLLAVFSFLSLEGMGIVRRCCRRLKHRGIALSGEVVYRFEVESAQRDFLALLDDEASDESVWNWKWFALVGNDSWPNPLVTPPWILGYRGSCTVEGREVNNLSLLQMKLLDASQSHERAVARLLGYTYDWLVEHATICEYRWKKALSPEHFKNFLINRDVLMAHGINRERLLNHILEVAIPNHWIYLIALVVADIDQVGSENIDHISAYAAAVAYLKKMNLDYSWLADFGYPAAVNKWDNDSAAAGEWGWAETKGDD